jgi:hypothetical protein
VLGDACVDGHIAAATKTIRVGSGGVMLPNHAPLVVAEQFGTLVSRSPHGRSLASVKLEIPFRSYKGLVTHSVNGDVDL